MSDVLGEASIRIRPDTTTFAAELKAQVAGGTAATAAAVQAQAAIRRSAAATQAAGASAGGAAAATKEFTRAQNLQTIASSKLAFANREVVATAGAVAAAQTTASRASAAVLASEQAVAAARAAGIVQAIRAAEATHALAVAQQREAITALEAAKAQAVHASQFGFVRRGALASALSLLGIRGATLAANSAFLIGAAAIAVFAKSLGVFANFERQLNVLRVTTGATADEMERVSDVAVQLGADVTLPGVSAGDAAEAMTELAKAGLSVQDAMEGARGVLQLATAANISNADATTLAASALNAFGLAGNQAVRVADVLANAANAAQGSIQDMGFSLQQAAAVGRQVGLSLEDTTVFLTSLTRAGLRGSDAGTSLRTTLLRLINPTKKVQAVIDELGVAIRDSQGNIRTDFFVNLGLALESLSKEQRDAKIAILGGADAIRALSILSRQSIEDLLGLRNQIREQGTAAEVASARTSGLAGAGSALANTLENVGLVIGRTVAPGLTNFTHGLTQAIAAISASEGVRETLRDSLSIIGNSFEALGATLGAVGPPLVGLAGLFQQTISSIGVAEILAAVVAYKLFIATMARATVAAAAFHATTAGTTIATSGLFAAMAVRAATARNAMTAAGSASAALSVGLRAAGAGMLAFAASTAGIGIAVAALAGGLIYLVTRESAAERATRHLKDSADALRGSLSALTSVTDSLARATSNVASEQLAVQSAQLAAASARNALANNTAAKGSLERKQLENALAVALDNVRLSEQRLAETRKEQALLAAELQQAEINNTAALQKRVEAINEVVDAIEREVRIRSIQRGVIGTERRAAGLVRIEADAIEDLTKKLRERADEEAAVNTESSRAIAKRLRLIAVVAEETNKLPSERAIEILVETPNLKSGLAAVASEFGITGKRAVAAFTSSLIKDLHGSSKPFIFALETDILMNLWEKWREGGKKSADVYWQAFIDAGNAAREKVATAMAAVISRSNAKIAALDRQALDLEIQGASPQALLANLQRKRSEQQKVVERQERRFAAGDIAVDQVTKAKEDLAETVGKIRALEEEIRGDAESAQREIEQARDKADQAAIDAFTGKRTRLENLLIRAGGTEGLGDDVKFNKMLVALLRKQIKLAADRIKSLVERRDFIQDTNRLILQITNQIKDDERKQRDLLKQQREDRQQERDDKLKLNIEFAQINENVRAEIRARSARIRALQAQQRQILKEKGQRAKNTAAYLELRNEIAREKAAIKELREELKLGNEAQKLIFQFLQTQQGFAANLLGNLIPAGVTGLTGGGGGGGGGGGIVTGSAGGGVISDFPGVGAASFGGGLSGALIQEAGISEAGKDRGPSQGQLSDLIAVNRAMLAILHRIAGDTKHPEAKRSKMSSRAMLDMLA